MYGIERTHRPNLETVEKIARALGMPVSALIPAETDSQPAQQQVSDMQSDDPAACLDTTSGHTDDSSESSDPPIEGAA